MVKPPAKKRRNMEPARPHSLRVSDGFRSFVLDQLEPLGSVLPKSMFGGVGLYCDGVFFGLIALDVLYLKVDDTNRPDYEAAGAQPFRPYPERSGTTRVLRGAGGGARKPGRADRMGTESGAGRATRSAGVGSDAMDGTDVKIAPPPTADRPSSQTPLPALALRVRPLGVGSAPEQRRSVPRRSRRAHDDTRRDEYSRSSI